MAGSVEALDLCRHQGLEVAVCSGSYAVVIEAALRRLDIESRVSVWHSAEWEPLGKPHPGPYLSTAAKLDMDPVTCLAVEDSFNGAISAKAARMRVVAGARGRCAFSSPRWGFCDATLQLHSEAFDELACFAPSSPEIQPAGRQRPRTAESEGRGRPTGVVSG